ncbi:DUF4296 domain-containing protein [Seonamhaeicola sp. ML3]|uniref:DUF4296 domain-containing protein n=1 Tax=Seonamhaeicola sp. ML3 TaxID=2937786 RepID=UPI0021122E4D|nr:DUF4296 domain-containing protein [Seonamhaeicola sp. ML3]
MYRLTFLVLFIVFCLLGCTRSISKPKNLISKKDMVCILIDAKLISSASPLNKKILQENRVFPNSYIFKKYNIDSAQFAESNMYYTHRVKDYEEIYQMVKDSLDLLETKYKELKEAEIKIAERKSRDSLNQVLKTRDSLREIAKDSKTETVGNNPMLIHELEDIDIDDELELIDPVSDK